MRLNKRIGLCWLAFAVGGASSLHAAECSLGKVAELPVTMNGSQPIINASINGKSARFLLDSGAFFNTLTLDAAKRLELGLRQPPDRFKEIYGVGGSQRAWLSVAKDFTLDGFSSNVFHNVEFLTTDSSMTSADGLLGQNLLGYAETEYDLANGAIRIFRAKDCGDRSLAYWSRGMSVGVVETLTLPTAPTHIIGTAKLNGKTIRVMFDTGASSSVLQLDTAAKVGMTPDDDKMEAIGYSSGIGKRTNATYVGRFDLLDLGGEQIKNARLRVADFSSTSVDMLLGADFFLSHRVFVAKSQKKVYFTYNGGRVFDLGTPAAKPMTASQSTDTTAVASAAIVAGSLSAAEYKRRGAASAGRRDFEAAIADFDQAIKVDSTDAEALYMRGSARMNNRQPLQAGADFDAALKLKPDHLAALMDRGTLRVYMRNIQGANEDFDAATKLAANDNELTLRIAQTYAGAQQFDEAIRRYDQWLAQNPKDSLAGAALTGRCWARANQGADLQLALADCDAALKKRQHTSSVFDSRALVYLRMGKFDDAIKDYKASLKLLANTPGTLYGLGVAETKKGDTAQGEAHIKEALQFSPNAGDTFKRINLVP